MNSKIKGNNYEREIAKTLSLWITGGADAFALIRSPNSGGAVRDKQGLTGHSGDIRADKKVAYGFVNKFHVEVKHYKDLSRNVVNFFIGKDKFIEGVITKAKKEAADENKKLFVIIKSNRVESLVFLEKPKLFKRFENSNFCVIHLKYKTKKLEIVLIKLENLLNHNYKNL